MGLTLHGLIHNAIHSCMIPFFSSKPPNHDSTDSELHNTDQETSIPDHPPSVEPKHPPQIVSIDDILKNWAGEFGKSQALHFTISSFAWALEALHTLVVVFADKNPSWRCITNANPMAAHSSPILCGGSMHMSSICSMDRSLWEWTHGKSESTVSEWDLICGNTYKKGLAQSSFFIGCLIGSGIFGHLSDSRIGRKGALVLACLCNGIFGMLTAASPNLPVYAILRALTGISTGGLGLTSFVLGTECIGPTKRSSVSMSSLYFYPLGTILLAGLAAIASGLSWRYLYIITSAPSLVYLVFIVPFLSESPRWYLVRGRKEEAMRVLMRIAKTNGRKLPEGVALSMELDEDQVSCGPIENGVTSRTTQPLGGLELRKENIEVGDEPIITKKAQCVKECGSTKGQARGTLLDVFKRDDTRTKILILIVVWFVSALGYYSLNLNVGNVGTNLSLSLVLNALAEIPGYATSTILANKPGRRFALIAAMLLCATSCLMAGGVSFWLSKYATSLSRRNVVTSLTSRGVVIDYHSQVRALLRTSSYMQLVGGLFAIFSVAGSYNLLYLYTAELFPTVVRNAALGLTNQAASIGCIISPINVLSAHLGVAFPFFIIGAASLVGGLMTLKLPETHNQPFHETFEEMNKRKDVP